MKKYCLFFFTLSLALNGLLLGLIAGDAMKSSDSPRKHSMHAMEAILQQLPEAKAAMVMQQMDAVRQNNKTYYKIMHDQRRVIIELIQTEPFDADAYQEAVDMMQQARRTIMQSYANSTKQIAGTLNADERAIYAEALKAKFSHYRKKRAEHR